MTQYRTPNGSLIIGTLETVTGVAAISGIDETGQPTYAGGTNIDWDSQRTVTRDGKLVFVDEHGHEWTMDQLTAAKNDDE